MVNCLCFRTILVFAIALTKKKYLLTELFSSKLVQIWSMGLGKNTVTFKVRFPDPPCTAWTVRAVINRATPSFVLVSYSFLLLRSISIPYFHSCYPTSSCSWSWSVQGAAAVKVRPRERPRASNSSRGTILNWSWDPRVTAYLCLSCMCSISAFTM